MKFRRGFQDDSEVIPTASMADITFLLIIFFMVGTVFNVEKGIEMNLPKSTVQQEISEDNIIISIDSASHRYGKLYSESHISMRHAFVVSFDSLRPFG